MLFALVAAAAGWKRLRPPEGYFRERWAFWLVVCGLALLALSHRWALGSFELFELPMPAILAGLFGAVRSSGRFVWPLMYLLALAAVVALAMAHPGRRLVALASVAVLLQAGDGAAGWDRANDRFAQRGTTIRTPLVAPFWHEAAAHYRTIRLIPPANNHPTYESIAYLAARNGMGTDNVYLARVDIRHMRKLADHAQALLERGGFQPDTLYILSDAAAERAELVVDAQRDLLTRIDGLNVLAPGWFDRPAR